MKAIRTFGSRDWSPPRRRCSFGRQPRGGMQKRTLRRVVRDYIAAAIDRARPRFEQFIAGHLECPESVPLILADRLATIREIRGVKITPRYRADFPEVNVAVPMQVSVMVRTRRDYAGQGTRPFLLDVTLDAVGTVAGHGYNVVPQRARLVAWWGG
jgi:hypothetical protein